MKYILITIFTAFSLASLANEKTTVKITSLTNGARSTVLEACGTATHIEGKKNIARHSQTR